MRVSWRAWKKILLHRSIWPIAQGRSLIHASRSSLRVRRINNDGKASSYIMEGILDKIQDEVLQAEKIDNILLYVKDLSDV